MRRRWIESWVIILCLVAPLRAADAPAPADKPAAMQLIRDRAVAPLIDFAQWCAKNGAKTAGQEALGQAKAINPDAAKIAEASSALDNTADTAGAATVTHRKSTAYDAAASMLDRLAASPHDASDDGQFEGYRLQAFQLSPQSRVSHLWQWIKDAEKADRWDTAANYFALALHHDFSGFANQKYKDLEIKLAEHKLLAHAMGSAVTDIVGAKQYGLAAAMLLHAATVDPKGVEAGDYADAHDALRKDQFLLHVPDHAMVAYVGLPKDWDGRKKWPIFICFPGADGGFQGCNQGFRGTLSSLPYIVVTPCVFSDVNGVQEETYNNIYPHDLLAKLAFDSETDSDLAKRLAFDVPGTLAVIRMIQQNFNGENRVYVTGASGGGLPTYALTLTAPQMIAASAPSCPNYYGSAVANIQRGENCGPVIQFLGEKDQYNLMIKHQPGIIPQSDLAMIFFKSKGYRISRVVVAGAPHGFMTSQIVEFFENIRTGGKKAG